MNPSERIKKYIDDRGISQTWLSKKTGIALAKINASLNGKRKIPLSEFELICKALGVAPNVFIYFLNTDNEHTNCQAI